MEAADASEFSGSSLDEWLRFFKLEELADVLEEQGASEVDELIDIYNDTGLLEEIQGSVKPLTFKKFLKTAYRTPQLRVVTTDISFQSVFTRVFPHGTTTVMPGASATAPISESERATYEVLAERVDRTRDRVARLEGSTSHSSMSRSAPSSRAPGKSTISLTELKAELKRLEDREKILTVKAEEAHKLREEKTKLTTKLEKKKRRGLQIEALDRHLTEAASLDVCITLDCTGSMFSYINAAKEQVNNFVDSLARFYPNIPLRLAFVAYRDHCDGSRRLNILPFTKNISQWKEFVASQPATGGGDGPEDVMGALNATAELEWTAATRILYHIADAPCHGTRFHDDPSDSYPSGDPLGLTPESLLPRLQSRNVLYFFGKISGYTDKMIRVFNEITPRFIETTPLTGAHELMTTLTKSVTSTLTASLSKSAGKYGEEVVEAVELEPRDPNWRTVPPEPIQVFEMAFPESISELVDEDEDSCEKCISKIPLPMMEARVAPKPFAKGAVRAAHKARVVKDGAELVMVHKRSIVLGKKKYSTREHCESELSAHRAAAFLAEEFNKVRPDGCPAIRYVSASVFQYLTRPGNPYAIQEQHIEGYWEKFNGNNGFVCPNPSPMGVNHDAVQAFSHWTHHVTDRNMIVTDCQGAFNSATNTFVLTDPAIHCTNNLRFYPTNLARAGFTRFFETHVCNDYCRSLDIAA